MRCTSCQFENPPGMKFCGNCGSRLVAPASTTSGEDERRVVTAVSADMVGFTAMSEKLDPEQVKQIMSRCLGRLADEVVRFGGAISSFAGDALIAYFGAPVAHEDDPERAVRAAMAMQEAAGEFAATVEAEVGVRVQVRIGLHTGTVVAGILSSDERRNYTVTGDALTVASKVQSAATAGRVSVSDSAYQLTRQFFEYEGLGEITLPGRAEPIPIYHLVGIRRQRGKVRGLEGMNAPLIGRSIELQQLLGSYEQAVANRQTTLVTLWGVAGQGKSRLVAEFNQQLQGRDNPPHLLHGRCLPFGQGITYWPFSEMLRDECEIGEGGTAGETQERLVAGVRRLLSEAGEESDPLPLAARLGALVGISVPGSNLAGLSNFREEVVWAWRSFFAVKAGRAPLLIFIEDIHWAKPPLLDLLTALAGQMHDVPALLLCTSRPELREEQPDWAGKSMLNIELEPLDHDESNQLVNALLQVDDLPAEVRATIVQRAEGNPLYVEEIIRSLVDSKLLLREGGRWRAVADIGQRLQVPGSVQALLTARIDMLIPAEQRRILQDAAVVGRNFWPGAVASVTGGQFSQAQVDRYLDSLVDRGMVQPDDESDFAGEDEYSFRHALIQDVAYAMLPKVSRSQKHARAAGWLERAAGDRLNELVDRIAYHYEQAVVLADTVLGEDSEEQRDGWAEQAVKYMQIAADNYLGLQDYRTAQAFCQRAVDVLPQALRNKPEHLKLLWTRAINDMQMGNLDEASEQVRQLYPLCVELKAKDIQSDASWLLGWVTYNKRDAELAADFYQQSLELSEMLDDSKRSTRALIALADLYVASSTLESATEAGVLLHRVLEMSVATKDDITRVKALNSQVLLYTYLKVNLHKAGRIASQLVSLLEAVGDRQQLVNALINLSVISYSVVDYAGALQYTERCLRLAGELGYRWGEMQAHHIRALALTALARYDEARDHYLRALEISTQMGERNLLPEIRRGLAEAHLGLGELERALEQAEIACDVVLPDDPYSQATTARARAMVLAASGRDDEAEADFRRSLALLDGSSFKAELAASLERFAAYLQARGRSDEAGPLDLRAAAIREEISRPAADDALDVLAE